MGDSRYNRLWFRFKSIDSDKLDSVGKKGFNLVIDLAVYTHVQQLVEHNIEVNFVKCLGIIQIDDISVAASFKDVEEIVKMLEELT